MTDKKKFIQKKREEKANDIYHHVTQNLWKQKHGNTNILCFFYWMVSNLSLCIKIWPCLQMTKLGKIKHHIYNRYFIYRLKKNKVLGCTLYTLCTNHQLFSPLDVDHFYPRFFSHFCTVLIIFVISFAWNR